MSILNGALFDNYVSDVAVTMVVGLGYYLFNSLKKKTSWKDQSKEMKNLKSKLEVALERYQYAKTIEEYNELINSDYKGSEDPFAILNEMMKKGLVPNTETYNALLLNSLKTGNCQTAKLLKEEVMDITGPVAPNNYTLNIFIKGIQLNYSKSIEINPKQSANLHRKFDEELSTTISKLQERGIHLDTISVNTILDALIEQNRMEKTWETFNTFKKIIKPDVYTYTSLLKGIKNMTMDAEWLNRAFLILEEAKIGYNLEESLFNSLLDSCIKYNRTDKAVELFKEMKEKNKNNLSEYAYSMMIKVYGKSYNLDKCMEMFNLIKNKGLTPSPVSYVSLMNVCLRCRKVDLAEKLLEEMGRDFDTEIYNTIYFNLINGYKNIKCFEKAMKLFEKLISTQKIALNISVYNSILDCCVQFNKFEKMEQVYSKLLQTPLSLDAVTYSILLKGYSNWNKKDETIQVYKKVKSMGFELDEVIYNRIMDLFVRSNEEIHVNTIYKDMKQKGLRIGVQTYTVLMKLYCKMGNSSKAFELFDDMVNKEITLTENVYQMLIELHIKGNYLSRAISLFKNMLISKISPSNCLYEILITACRNKGKDGEGLELVMSALNEKIKIENSVIDKVIENIIASNQLQIAEKIDILSRFSMLLKELSLLISSLSYDKLSKFLFQNKTLNKLSSFSESSIYSTAPVPNTVTQIYNSGNRFENNVNNSNVYELSQGNSYDNYSVSRNPFMKNQASTIVYSTHHNNINNQYQNNNQYSQGNYYSQGNSKYAEKEYRTGYNTNNKHCSSVNSNTLSTGSKSLYSSSGNDNLFGTNSFERGNNQ